MPKKPKSRKSVYELYEEPENAKAAHWRDVTWLPPQERLYHLALTGQPPSQYSHHMCSIVSERHPLGGFVRTVPGSTLRAAPSHGRPAPAKPPGREAVITGGGAAGAVPGGHMDRLCQGWRARLRTMMLNKRRIA